MYTVLYGTGSLTPLAQDQLGDNKTSSEILYATTEGNEIFNSQAVISLAELSKVDFSLVDKLIICSMYVEQICESLIKIDFPLSKIFYFHITEQKIKKVQLNKDNGLAPNSILYAFYDLSIYPPSYDIYRFVLMAEAERKARKMQSISFIVVPKLSSAKKKVNNHTAYDVADYFWRKDNIVIPIMRSMKSCISVNDLAYREEVDFFLSNVDQNNVFPCSYNIEAPPVNFVHKDTKRFSKEQLGYFEAPAQALNIVDNFINEVVCGKQVVTITLREYGEPAARNTQLSEWGKFIETLDRNKFFPVIIRDTYLCTNPIPSELGNVLDFPAASMNISVRIALYTKAYLNFCVPNGPTTLLFHIKNCRTILIRKNDDSIPSISKRVVEMDGYPENEQPDFADFGYQLVHWGEDNFENIRLAFDKFESQRAI